MIIDGNKISEKIIKGLSLREAPKKFLAVFSVAPNSATLSFMNKKKEIAEKLGIDFRIYIVEECINNDELRRRIGQVALAKKCGGVILQLPIPDHLNPDYAINAVPLTKDIELMTSRGAGDFYKGRSKILPPSVATLLDIFNEAGENIDNIKEAAVIGAGKLIGKPIATYLMSKIEKVVVLEKGANLEKEIKNSDLVVGAADKASIIRQDMMKKGSIFIDFGYSINRKTKKLEGNLDKNSIKNKFHFKSYTPTPGGTGPILVAELFKNFYELNL